MTETLPLFSFENLNCEMWNLNGKMNNVAEEGVLLHPIGAADFADFLHAYPMSTWFYFDSKVSSRCWD
jgi:hypothetical protein